MYEYNLNIRLHKIINEYGYTPNYQDSCYLASLWLHPQDLDSMNPFK